MSTAVDVPRPCGDCGGRGTLRTLAFGPMPCPCRGRPDGTLSDANRSAILARMRADRLARNGAPRPDDAAIDRSVRASSRLAGVPDHIIDAALATARSIA